MNIRMGSQNSLLAVALGLAITLALMPPRADAADILVNNTSDGGPGSLRQALLDANPGDRVVFHSSLAGQAITPSNDLPLIDKDLSFDTTDAPGLTVGGTLRVDARWSVVDSFGGDVDLFSNAIFEEMGEIDGNVTSEGTLSAGNGSGSIETLTFDGDLAINDGKIVVDIQPASNFAMAGTHNDVYRVTGDALVAGATVVVRFAEPSTTPYVERMRYYFMSVGGTITTSALNRNRVVGDFAFLTVRSISSRSFFLVDNNRNFADVAVTCNQTSAAQYLELFRDAGDLPDIINRFRSSSTDQARAGFEQLGGEIYPSLVSSHLQHTSFNLAMLRNQLVLEVPRGGEETKTSGWVRGYGLSGDADRDSCGTRGYQTGLGGTEIAIQRSWGAGTAIGGFANLGWSKVELEELSQQGRADSYQFGGLFRHVGRYAYVLGIGGSGYQDYEVDRRIDAAMLDGAMSSDFDGDQTFGYLELGTLRETSGYYWMPHAAVQYIRLNHDKFSESFTGSDGVTHAVALRGHEIDADSTRSILGLSLKRTGPALIGPATAKIRGGWMHEYGDTHATLRSRFKDPAANGVTPLLTRGVDVGRDWAVLGVNLLWSLHPGVRLLGSYQTQLNAQQAFHAGAGGVEARW